MSNPWVSEIWRVVFILLAVFLVGLVSGDMLIPLVIASVGYSAWQLYKLHRLNRSFHEGNIHKLPDTGGLWGEVYHHIHHLQKRNRDRKKRLTNILSRFKESTAALPDGTVVLTDQWEIEWYNDAARSLLGLKHKKDIGQRIDNLIRDPRFVNYVAKNDFSDPIELVSPIDPQTHIMVRIIPYARNQQLMVVRDFTRLYRLEQMRRDFVANVSHELRTPLTVITGYLETMADSDDEALQNWRRSINQMNQQSRRMDNIVEDLLLLSRLDASDQVQIEEIVPVTNLLESIRQDAITLSGEHAHQIKLDADNELQLKGNKKELYSAFANLVFNAVRYTPDQSEIKILWYQNGKGAHLEIADNGPGIPPQHTPRLTERFYRVDAGRSRESGGTGLGLAIVKHVLVRHDGDLRINSRLGEGSTFTCNFPPERILTKEQPIK